MPDDDPIRRAAEAAYDWLNAPGQRDGSGTRSQLIGELAEVLRESDLARNAAAVEHALCMVLLWCRDTGEPCDGFRFRGEVLAARQLLGHKTCADDLRRATELRGQDSTLHSASAAVEVAKEKS